MRAKSMAVLGLSGASLIAGVAGAAESEPSANAFRWPGGARAAVCLTYDDGLDSHLDIAAPDLDVAGLRGTFFCTGQSESLRVRMPEWRALALRGHELGNHALFHPCEKTKQGRDVFEWVRPWYDLGGYPIERIVDELGVASTLLAAVDGRSERTFAYNCSDFEAGGESFVDAIRPLFVAARNDGPIPDAMRDVDPHFVPSLPVEDPTAEQLIAYVERAAEKGTLGVIMFHNVGGGYLNTSREAHRELLKHLAANRDRLWTATFVDVMTHVESEARRLGWRTGR